MQAMAHEKPALQLQLQLGFAAYVWGMQHTQNTTLRDRAGTLQGVNTHHTPVVLAVVCSCVSTALATLPRSTIRPYRELQIDCREESGEAQAACNLTW